jgi:hypothetical protein
MKRILIVALPTLAVLVALGLGLYFFRSQTLGVKPGLKVTDEEVGEAKP